MGTLRLLEPSAPSEPHEGEVYSCAYSPDGAFVLSAGWDGLLRLWDANSGAVLVSLPVSPRPLSSCAFSPDGRQWLSGTMEGLLGIWDGVSYHSLSSFIAHTRPISSITYSPNGQTLVTASWDRAITVRKVGLEREGRNLTGHTDIVAGTRFTADGGNLVSWSYDGTIKIWDLNLGREVANLAEHTDRVLSASLSPDGRALISGGRDGMVRMWDLEARYELATVNIGAEIRACFFLLDARSAVVVDDAGRIFLFAVPSFTVQAQVQTPFRVMGGDLSPSGTQLALGGEDGRVHFVGIEGYEEVALVVTAQQMMKDQPTLIDRMFGKTRVTRLYSYTCPACRQTVESTTLPVKPVACPRCQRQLKISARVPVLSS